MWVEDVCFGSLAFLASRLQRDLRLSVVAAKAS